jgi:hypothetical protein
LFRRVCVERSEASFERPETKQMLEHTRRGKSKPLLDPIYLKIASQKMRSLSLLH